jgi:hypothetical protein
VSLSINATVPLRFIIAASRVRRIDRILEWGSHVTRSKHTVLIAAAAVLVSGLSAPAFAAAPAATMILPWLIGRHVIAGVIGLATLASVAAAPPPAPYAPPPAAYYPPRYYPAPASYGPAPSYAAPPYYTAPSYYAAPRYYPTPGYYGGRPYARGPAYYPRPQVYYRPSYGAHYYSPHGAYSSHGSYRRGW